MDWNLVVRSQQYESKREKEADILRFMQKTNKALDKGLASRRHRLPSRGESTVRLLEGVLETQAGE